MIYIYCEKSKQVKLKHTPCPENGTQLACLVHLSTRYPENQAHMYALCEQFLPCYHLLCFVPSATVMGHTLAILFRVKSLF